MFKYYVYANNYGQRFSLPNPEKILNDRKFPESRMNPPETFESINKSNNDNNHKEKVSTIDEGERKAKLWKTTS